MKSSGPFPTRRVRALSTAPLVALSLGVGISVVTPGWAHAQARDFLFRAPVVNLTLRGGYNVARAGGDLFDFTRENLTLDRADFGALAVAADLAFRVSPRFDVVLGLAHAGTSVRSEFRDWVEETASGDSLPIEQQTRFRQTPLTAGVRYYLVPRGRQVGRFVWIPTRFQSYVGVSAGTVHYRFRQEGDWVDFQDSDIFHDVLETSGWTAIVQAVGGIELGVTPWMALVTEARLSAASAEPGLDFVGFEGLDLSGLQLTAGLSFRM